MSDEDICFHHAPGHCWHRNGAEAFKGKFESTIPVVCCHCKATAVQVSISKPVRIERYTPKTEGKP